MPKVVNFGGKKIVEAGVYSRIIGGEPAPISGVNFGTVLLIDTGVNQNFGSGSGIDGELTSGLSSIWSFKNYDDFADWNNGGELLRVVKNLFNPSDNGSGASEVLLVSGCKTTSSQVVIGSGGIQIKNFTEGLQANGIVSSGKLISGFGVRVKIGVRDSAKFIIQFWRNKMGIETLLIETPELTNSLDFKTWADSTVEFNSQFKIFNPSYPSFNFASSDLTNGFELFSGATELYDDDYVDQIIDSIGEIDYTFVITDRQGLNNAKHDVNLKLFNHLVKDALYDKFLILTAGATESEFDRSIGESSVTIAEFYNHSKVYVLHGDYWQAKTGGGYRISTPLEFAALICGRISGLEPQNSATWKNLSINGTTNELKPKQRTLALQKGIVHLKHQNNQWIVAQEVNCLQKNIALVYPDGQSPEGSIMRIVSALNKGLKQSMENEQTFIGGNSNTTSIADVKTFVEGYLIAKTATKDVDNLILSFKNIQISQTGTDIWLRYEFVPNAPINRIFITGVMLNVNL